MLQSRLSLPLAMLLSVLAAFAVSDSAFARAKTQGTGTFDCSCSGGSGTCSFSTSGPTMSCSKKSGDTCTGSCKLTTTPTGGGGAAAVKSGAATGKVKAAQ